MGPIISGPPYFLIASFPHSLSPRLSFPSCPTPSPPSTTPPRPPCAGAEVVALADHFLVQYVVQSSSWDYLTLNIVQLGMGLLFNAAELAAVLPLAHALLPRRATVLRWPVVVCFALAVTRLLAGAAAFVVLIQRPSTVGVPPPHPTWLLLFYAFDCLYVLCGTTLLVSAALYLAAFAARLQRQALGRAAAAALIPAILFDLEALARLALQGLATLSPRFPTTPLWHLPGWTHQAFTIYLLLFWLAIALFATILAARHRPPMIQ
jgi:hypothetical protein